MKKFLYVLLGVAGGAAGALAVKAVLDRRRRARLEGALPRPLPESYNGEVHSALDELRGPLAEI
ncbi:MAG: hypothetical protein NDJ72_04595 [Elusimicrobia bacterium]|nr:hypothetical protein [Elusimicrobiota bacterium]